MPRSFWHLSDDRFPSYPKKSPSIKITEKIVKKIFLIALFVIGLFWALSNYRGLATQGEYQTILLDFREDIPAQQVLAQVDAIAKQYNVAPRLNSAFSKADNLYVLPGDSKLLAALRQSPLAKLTESIEPDYVYSALEVPNDPDYKKQWNLKAIHAEEAWEMGKGRGAVVAVIDTGVSKVPDLKNTEFVAGYDFVNDRARADDDHGHGTHVAGTVAQSTNNRYGVAGIAYQSKIMPLKVLGRSGGGTVGDIAEAIKFAASNGADVINMSLGGGGESAVMKEAIEFAHQKGVAIVAAAGNARRSAAEYPARYPYVIGVSATNNSNGKAFYSNYGAGIDISAPGGDTREGPAGGILQNTLNPSTGKPIFAAFQGTSMASPHVAGVAALLKAKGVKDPDRIEEILKSSAAKVEEDPNNFFGAGRLDAAAALKMAGGGEDYPTLDGFLRWLRDNGFLNPRFWFDGGAIALLPKLLMVVVGYLVTWLLRRYLRFRWTWGLSLGLVAGSCGLFPLRGLYIFDLPQWPLRLLGSSVPELGTALQGSSALNPIFASVLIPFLLVSLLLGHPQWKWAAIGISVGVGACLLVSSFADPQLVWLGGGAIARAFLVGNALLCFLLAKLAASSAR